MGPVGHVWIPADVAGVQAGDLITSMENITVVSDGTLQDYCKILREHSPGDQLALRVVRLPTEQVLEGRLNGEPLKATEATPSTTVATTPPTTGAASQDGYASFVDASGKLSFDAPATWQYDGTNTQDGAVALTAAPDLQAWIDTWSATGAALSIPTDQPADPTALLTDASAQCQSKDEPQDFTNHGYTGKSQQWYQCDGQASFWNAIVQGPAGGSWIDVQVIFTTDDEQAVVNHVIDTFAVAG